MFSAVQTSCRTGLSFTYVPDDCVQTYVQLSVLWHRSPSTLTGIFDEMCHRLHGHLVPLHLAQPTADLILSHTPEEVWHYVQKEEQDRRGIIILVVVADTFLVETACPEAGELGRATYSDHHACHGVKVLTVTACSGRILFVLGPYRTPSADSTILLAALIGDTPLRAAVSGFVLAGYRVTILADRGFTPAANDTRLPLGITVTVPETTASRDDQFTGDQALSNLLLGRIRWVVEAAHSRMQQFRMLYHPLCILQITTVMRTVELAAAIANGYFTLPASAWLRGNDDEVGGPDANLHVAPADDVIDVSVDIEEKWR